MNPERFYKNVGGLIDPDQLRSKKAAIVGLGSGGSRVAAELGRLGVSLFLVERPGELLEEHNLARHLLDYRSLGKPKLAETIKRIRLINPDTRLVSCPLDVVDEKDDLAAALERWGADLIVVCTDTEASKHAVNEVAVGLGVPQAGAGVYDGGVGGEIYWVKPGGACYGCIAAQLHPERGSPAHSASGSEGSGTDGDYGETNPGRGRSTCALNLDIAQIALLHARISLDLLLGDHAGSTGLPANINFCVFANRALPGIFARPWHGRFYSLPRRKECLCCGQPPDDVEREADRILSSLGTPPIPNGTSEL
jgi:molybdopterin/thiamine biosynthesis adenylyltransferase